MSGTVWTLYALLSNRNSWEWLEAPRTGGSVLSQPTQLAFGLTQRTFHLTLCDWQQSLRQRRTLPLVAYVGDEVYFR